MLLCTNKVTMVRHAVKIISFAYLNRSQLDGTRVEIQTLQQLRHPNIVGLVDIIVSDTMDLLCLVLEPAWEGELSNYIAMKEKLTEAESRSIFRQLFSAVAYIVSACDLSLQLSYFADDYNAQ